MKVLDNVINFLNSNEVKLPSNNNVNTLYLEIPRDLTDLPTNEVCNYLNAIVQQKMYIRTLLSMSRAEYRESKSNYEKIKCMIYSESPARMSVTEKELRVYSDETATKAKADMDLKLEHFDFLKDVLESYDDGQFLISRELTRRLTDKQDTDRAGRFNA